LNGSDFDRTVAGEHDALGWSHYCNDHAGSVPAHAFWRLMQVFVL